jgi:glutathione S-transferase
MLKLYGFGRSNYYSAAKMALLEKGATFEEVKVFPSQDDDYLAKHPMGKVPCLETEHGFLSETSAIMDYAEEAFDGPSFYPANPWQRAKTRELMRGVELYIDLAIRPGIPEAFFKGSVSDEVKSIARKNLEKGIAAINRIARFDPYIAGKDFTYADMLAYYCLPLAAGVAGKFWGLDPIAEIPGAEKMIAAVAERPSAIAIAEALKS